MVNLAEFCEGQFYGYYLNRTVSISSKVQLFIGHCGKRRLAIYIQVLNAHTQPPPQNPVFLEPQFHPKLALSAPLPYTNVKKFIGLHINEVRQPRCQDMFIV